MGSIEDGLVFWKFQSRVKNDAHNFEVKLIGVTTVNIKIIFKSWTKNTFFNFKKSETPFFPLSSSNQTWYY